MVTTTSARSPGERRTRSTVCGADVVDAGVGAVEQAQADALGRDVEVRPGGAVDEDGVSEGAHR